MFISINYKNIDFISDRWFFIFRLNDSEFSMEIHSSKDDEENWEITDLTLIERCYKEKFYNKHDIAKEIFRYICWSVDGWGYKVSLNNRLSSMQCSIYDKYEDDIKKFLLLI